MTSLCAVCAHFEEFLLRVSEGGRRSVAIEISCKQDGYLCTYFAVVFQISLTVNLHWEIKSEKVSYPNSIKKNPNWLMISESRPGSREESRLDVAFEFRDCKAKMKKKQQQPQNIVF